MTKEGKKCHFVENIPFRGNNFSFGAGVSRFQHTHHTNKLTIIKCTINGDFLVLLDISSSDQKYVSLRHLQSGDFKMRNSIFKMALLLLLKQNSCQRLLQFICSLAWLVQCKKWSSLLFRVFQFLKESIAFQIILSLFMHDIHVS